jgi:hypothetical protein
MGLSFRVALWKAHQHTDPSHPLVLLRSRGNRPCYYGNGGYKRDELAPFHASPKS